VVAWWANKFTSLHFIVATRPSTISGLGLAKNPAHQLHINCDHEGLLLLVRLSRDTKGLVALLGHCTDWSIVKSN